MIFSESLAGMNHWYNCGLWVVVNLKFSGWWVGMNPKFSARWVIVLTPSFVHI